MTMVRNGGYEGTGPPEAHRVVPLKRAASLKALNVNFSKYMTESTYF